MDSEAWWKKFKGRETPSTVQLDESFCKMVPKGSKVLDFACGWGRMAFKLQECGYDVVGFDINQEAVENARKASTRFNSIYKNRVSFDVANARDLPYPDGSFDVCLIQAFMTALVDPEHREMVLDEARRVLREDGILYLADFGQSWDNPIYRARYLKDFKKTGEMGTFIVTGDGSPESPEIFRAHHYTQEELMKLIKPRFTVEMFKETVFTTYHGNKASGFVIMARKK
ncbi:class I SAM-dependent methyltransferase [Methanobacterium congolense]|uniref:Methyltransferase type 11 n=1 Tax=Methanobacterium congolense TaxID=118062 RepID=A0A1D3L1D8_9EURY|nr:class I SAM-dependent methyltransferase [Methanobacterium congolense]SCG85375.1 Methyltransferase type 11 [Methanobacterium congolense]